MKKLLDGYYVLLKYVLTLLIAILIIPVSMQILARYVGLIPRYIWTEELARFCFIWIIMVGSMIAMRDGDHFNVDLLPKPKTAAGKALSALFADAMSMLLAVIFIVWGWPLVQFGLLQTSEMADLPMVFIYIAWPLTGVTWMLFLFERMWGHILQYRGDSA